MNIYKKETIHTGNPADHSGYATLATLWGLVTVLILIVIKGIAFILSGSAALLGSLIDSLGDAAISLITFFSVRLSLTPPDEEHRFGHGKIEGFSAMVQASFFMGAAVFVMFESIKRLFVPVEITHHMLGIGVCVIATLLSILTVAVQGYVLKRFDSLAIEADQSHFRNDALINISVILGLLIHMYTDWVVVDALFGVVIALYFGWSGYEIGSKATDMLMDREIEEEKRQLIIDTVNAHEKVHSMHDLRTRRAGMNIIISFDVELDGDLSLRDAHEISRELEYALLEHFPNAEILIHKDPEGDTYDTRHRVQGVHH